LRTFDPRRDDLRGHWLIVVGAIAAFSLGGGAVLNAESAFAAPHANWWAGPVAFGTGYHRTDGSERVREVQRTLRRLGYRAGPPDGLFGPRTQRAVLGFQRAHALQADGIVGHHTLGRLR
jgi:hypothetical protein